MKKTLIEQTETEKQVMKVSGKWQEIVTVLDATGNILSRVITPLKVEFHLKDVLQVIVGASLLAIPIGFTEETWRLGEQLPMANVIWFPILSFLFIGLFVYYNYYHKRLRNHWLSFIKRIFFTYFFSFVLVAILMHVIDKTPWATDWMLALKRVLIVTFPCALSGTIADTLK